MSVCVVWLDCERGAEKSVERKRKKGASLTHVTLLFQHQQTIHDNKIFHHGCCYEIKTALFSCTSIWRLEKVWNGKLKWHFLNVNQILVKYYLWIFIVVCFIVPEQMSGLCRTEQCEWQKVQTITRKNVKINFSTFFQWSITGPTLLELSQCGKCHSSGTSHELKTKD